MSYIYMSHTHPYNDIYMFTTFKKSSYKQGKDSRSSRTKIL